MKKNNRISINAFEQASNLNYMKESTVEWNGLNITVKRNLSLSEMLVFVADVTKACFGNSGEYRPQLKDFAIRVAIIELYTNLSLPSDISKTYDLVTHGDIIGCVTTHIDGAQFEKMIESIEDNIANINSTNQAAAMKQAEDIYGALNIVQEQLASVFANVTPEDMAGIIKAISDVGTETEDVESTRPEGTEQ